MPARPLKFRALRRLAVSSLLAALVAGVSPLASATTTKHKSHTSAEAKPAAKKTSSKSSGKSTSGKSGSKSSKGSSKSGKGKACYETVTKKGKKHKVKVACEAAEPVLSKSPINSKALEQSGQPLDNSPVKARSAPIRAYAVDGTTFFHNGRKFRIEGLDPDTGVELTHANAAQRLQQILDSGTVTTEALGPDDSGAMRAIVRVDGRDVAELMKQRP
jgi:hypothetical protein